EGDAHDELQRRRDERVGRESPGHEGRQIDAAPDREQRSVADALGEDVGVAHGWNLGHRLGRRRRANQERAATQETAAQDQKVLRRGEPVRGGTRSLRRGIGSSSMRGARARDRAAMTSATLAAPPAGGRSKATRAAAMLAMTTMRSGLNLRSARYAHVRPMAREAEAATAITRPIQAALRPRSKRYRGMNGNSVPSAAPIRT